MLFSTLISLPMAQDSSEPPDGYAKRISDKQIWQTIYTLISNFLFR